MRIFRQFKSPAIALDIGADGIRLLQIAFEENNPRLIASARRAFSDGKQITSSQRIAAIRRALAGADFAGKAVIAALPPDMVQVRTLRLPVVSAEQIDAIVRLDPDKLFPFNLDDANVHCMTAGLVRQSGREQKEVIVAAARNNDVSAFVAELEAAGLQPLSVRLAPFAAFHCARRGLTASSRGDFEETVALVEVGALGSNVMIARAGEVSFLKRIEIGGHQLNGAIAAKLSLGLDEVAQLRRRVAGSAEICDEPRKTVKAAISSATRAILQQLSRELEGCFRYHAVTFRGVRPTRVALLGPEAHDPLVQAAVGEGAPGTIVLIDPLAGIDRLAMRAVDCHAPAGQWTTCMGLLLGAQPGVNAVPRLPEPFQSASLKIEAAGKSPVLEISHA